MKVGSRYTDDLHPCSVQVIYTFMKDNLLSRSLVNCIDGQIEVCMIR